MRVSSLSQEGPLEKDMATHSSVLAWEIPWTEDLIPSRGSRAECFLAFSSFDVAWIPWLTAPSQHHMTISCFCHHRSS